MRRSTNVGDHSFAEADRDFDLTYIHDSVVGLNKGQKSQKELNNRVPHSTKDLLVEQTGVLFESIAHQRTSSINEII